MAYETVRLTSNKDIETCVDMYLALSDEDFMPSSRAKSLEHMWKVARQGRFIRALKRDGELVAWIYAEKVQLLHTDYPTFQQIYYASNQTGAAAARCVKILHQAMLDEARARGIEYCVSAASHLDPECVFSRILERTGWQRRGHVALARLGPRPGAGEARGGGPGEGMGASPRLTGVEP